MNYLIPRIGQYLMVIFVGVTLTFIIPRLSPNDPVETQVSQIMMRNGTAQSQSDICGGRLSATRSTMRRKRPAARSGATGQAD